MTVVIKIGGARAVDPAGALADVAHLTANGEDVVVVHGGSTAVDDTLERLGEEPTYVETPDGVVGRFTDAETMDVFEMVLPGKLNTDLVTALQNEGVRAVGLSGVDGQLLSGPRKSAVRVQEDGKRKIKRGDHSGTITDVNEDVLETLLEAGYTPVTTVPMLGKTESTPRGPEKHQAGQYIPVNVDTDRAAAAIAGAFDATLVVLTDVPGILADPEDDATLFETVDTPEALDAVETAAEGFMTRKVMAATEALEAGAEEVVVADATLSDPVIEALGGGGTHLTRSALGVEESTEMADTADQSTASTEDSR
jgi:acetylglutamate/LysW-gamma-L-alpha-aminoadipate kinase